MSINHVFKSLTSNRKVEFIVDDATPDYIIVKIGSSRVQLSSVEVAIMFSNITPFLTKAIEKEFKDNE